MKCITQNVAFLLIISLTIFKGMECDSISSKINNGEKTYCNDNVCQSATTDCVEKDGDYYCKCISGYRIPDHVKDEKENKEHCIKNHCKSDLCDSATTTCEEKEGGYYCKCKSGYRLEDKIRNEKENKKACLKNHCEDGLCDIESTTCEEKEGDYYCQCKPWYKLDDAISEEEDNKQACIKYDPCEDEYGGCDNSTTKCVPHPNGHLTYCECLEGYRRREEDYRKYEFDCLPVDQCAIRRWKGECQGNFETCKDGICMCKENYIYASDNVTCIANFCNNKCNEETENCLEIDDGVCICKPGYHWAASTCIKTDNCLTRKPRCSQICNNEDCSCTELFELKPDNYSCELRSDENKCTERNCSAGQCVKVNGEEKCICPDATHVEMYGECRDKCLAGKAIEICSGRCKSSAEYGFVCMCEGKFKTASDGVHCERKLMCTEGGMNEKCKQLNARCIEKPESDKGYECVCDNAYEVDQGKCVPKCDIKRYSDKCNEEKAMCTLNENYKPTCKCPPFYQRDNLNKMKCLQKATNTFIGNFTVPRKIYEKHSNTYTEKNKTIPIDYFTLISDFRKSYRAVFGVNSDDLNVLDCNTEERDFICTIELKLLTSEEEDLHAVSDSTICTTLENTEYCTIYPSLIMKRPEKDVFKSTNPCEPSVKKSLCGSMTVCKILNDVPDNIYFSCTCDTGFIKRAFEHPFTNDKESLIEHCEDIDECLNPTACPDNTTCINTPGSYECVCNTGYKTISKNVKNDGCIGVCDDNPCGQYGICIQSEYSGFVCNCSGINCNLVNKPQDTLAFNWMSGIILIASLIFLITAISVVTCIYRWKLNAASMV